jgi:hypothetical protein
MAIRDAASRAIQVVTVELALALVLIFGASRRRSRPGTYPAAASGTVPNRLSREWNALTAFWRSVAVKSGQRRSVK